MLFKLLYLLFLFLSFSGSNISIGPLAIRYILLLILFIDIIIIERKVFFEKIWVLYSIFVFVYGVSCVVTGFFDQYFSMLVHKYIYSFFCWFFTVFILTKDYKFAKFIILVLLFIGIFDTLVTVSQFTFNTSWYKPIETFFHFQSSEEYSFQVGSMAEGQGVATNALNGIFDSGTTNGYFLATCCVLSLVYFFKTKKAWLYVFPFLFFMGLFCCQQRGPLMISAAMIILSVYWTFKKAGVFNRILLLIGVSVAIVYAGYFLTFSEAMGLRYSEYGLAGTGREFIYGRVFQYIASHPIMANFYECLQETGSAPHNLFLNAYVYGGIISFVIIMWILYVQSKRNMEVIKGGFEGDRAYYYAFSLAWIAYTLNSLFHNKSIVTGEPIIWLLWGVVCSYPYIIHSKHVDK